MAKRLSRSQFRRHKNNIKYLEYYWSKFKAVNPDYRHFEHASTIRRLLRSSKYEKLRKVKYNRLTNTVILTNKQYKDLLRYSYISKLVEQEIKRY